jgi:predicted ATPase/class 3 adenylate cyclase
MPRSSIALSGRESALPVGTVTFLFTDIEASTRLLTRLGRAYDEVLAAHSNVIREAIASHDGVEVSTEGDAFFAVFTRATDAVQAAAQAQGALASHDWPPDVSVRVRMGLHTGEGRLGGDNYVGLDVNRAARIAAAGHGGQVLVSEATHALALEGLSPSLAFRDLGIHRLKDLPEPQRIWQLEIEGLPGDFPALRSDTPAGNLPIPATSFIGRTEELAAVVGLIRDHRLVTLTGAGGTGKTRLSLAAAHHLREAFPGGAWFVAMQDARDRASVIAAIAAALGVRETYERDVEAGVRAYLRDRRLLLVLDNFEQVVDTGAPLVAELLAEAPDLHVLITSRAVLRVADEHEWQVPPLGLPDPDRLPPLGALGRFEALALFVQRARAVAPGFALTDENSRAVTAICRRLDGLPLGIELAAARVKVLAPEAILDRLEHQLPVLSTAARDVPDRQRTLHSTIDWSFDLLDPPLSRLLLRLATFSGGWTLEAADAVANPDGELGLDTLDGIVSLVDNSLVRPMPAGDEPRFTMLQVIREYSSEKLDAEPEGQDIRRRHALWVAALAERARPELRRTDLREWQNRLRTEEENIRSALRWALDSGEAELGLRIAASLWDFWHYWAEVREGITWLESLLALPAAAGPTVARADGLNALGGLVYWQGRAERAWDLYEEAVSIRRELGDPRALADALYQSAWAAALGVDIKLATARALEAADLFRQAGDDLNAEFMEDWLKVEPVILGIGGDPAAALAVLQRANEWTAQMGRAHDAADWLGAKAMLHRMIGDPGGGIEVARAALGAWHRLGNLGRLPLAFKVLAALELQSGEPYRAVRLEAAAQRLIEDVGGDLFQAFGRLGNAVEEARPQLSPETHARAFEEGRTFGLDEQVAYALAPGGMSRDAERGSAGAGDS